MWKERRKMIEIKNLNKKENSKIIFEDLNIKIEDGDIVGVLGRKGSGKTLLLDMIMGIQRPTTGEVIVDGKDVYEDVLKVRKKIGSMANPSIYKMFTVKKFFEMQIRGKNIKNYEDKMKYIIEKFDINDLVEKNVADLSLEEEKKISVASAYIGEPEIVLLDDPFRDLTEEDMLAIGKLILKVKEKYTTIISSTNPHVIEKVCEKVILLGKNNKQKILKVSELDKSLKEIQDEFSPEN